MAQQGKRIDPEAPYVLLGYQLMDIMGVLQGMPRSTEGLCRQVESVLASAQLLQEPSAKAQPGLPQHGTQASPDSPTNIVPLPLI